MADSRRGTPGSEEPQEVWAVLDALAEPEGLWEEMVRGVGPATSQRQVAALAHRVAELLELTEIAAHIHPGRRPLQGFLERCGSVEGLWELDIEHLLMRLDVVSLWTAPFLIPSREEGADAGVVTFAHLSQPPSAGGLDAISVSVFENDGSRSDEHDLPVTLPVLAGAARDHLLAAISTATVLARSPEGFGFPTVEPPEADTDAEATRAADRLVELFTVYEQLLGRQAAAKRMPDGTTAFDEEVERQQAVLFDHAFTTKVTLRHRLPENTLEPIRLRIEAHTGHDPDGDDPLPIGYRLELDISEDHRGTGLIFTGNWDGTAGRAVHLPNMTHTWVDHIESAVLRSQIVAEGIRRTPADEIANPIPTVPAPIAESSGKSVILNEVDF
jgi:hypothetical protein